MANKKNIKRLIKLLEELPDDNFNMRYWAQNSECGTVCCIAGWAATLMKGGSVDGDANEICLNKKRIGKSPEKSEKFQKWFGMDTEDLASLFYGVWIRSRALEDITRKEAINHLKSLIN